MCLYTGEPLLPSELGVLEIEHIVPRSRGGPDAQYNYVLTREKTNKEKADRTPFEWLSSDPVKWAGYSDRVKARAGQLGRKRCELLLEKNAEELVENIRLWRRPRIFQNSRKNSLPAFRLPIRGA